jgi:predicted RNase H-like nuclease
MIFIGLDLAWSPRNSTGAAVIVGDATGGALVDVATLGDNAAIVAYIERFAGPEPAIVAVDAPLWVPNQVGRRRAESELARVFRAYEAAPHPANRQRLAFDGVVRGETLVAALAARGFTHRPAIDAKLELRQVIEVFPHPAMITFFDLTRTLKYKAKPKRSLELRIAEWRRYQAYLLALRDASPSLHGHEELLAQDVWQLRGRQLKRYEDQVDALCCAYIALYGFCWGAARCRTFGTLEEGYIFTPVPEVMRRR